LAGVRAHRPARRIRRSETEVAATLLSRSSSFRSFPSWSKSPLLGLSGCTKIKLDGFRMAARLDSGRVQLLTRTGLDWTGKYPGAIAALAKLNAKTAYLDGELCGVDDRGLRDGRGEVDQSLIVGSRPRARP